MLNFLDFNTISAKDFEKLSYYIFHISVSNKSVFNKELRCLKLISNLNTNNSSFPIF